MLVSHEVLNARIFKSSNNYNLFCVCVLNLFLWPFSHEGHVLRKLSTICVFEAYLIQIIGDQEPLGVT